MCRGLTRLGVKGVRCVRRRRAHVLSLGGESRSRLWVEASSVHLPDTVWCGSGSCSLASYGKS